MQTSWQQFLEQQGATIQSDGRIEFEYAPADLNSSPFISPLSDFTILEVSGNDRQAFLHGQFINDLNTLGESESQVSGWCNPKGQLISNMLIINTGQSYLLLFKASLKEFVLKRLSMFVLRSDVSIKDLDGSYALIGLVHTDNNALSDEKHIIADWPVNDERQIVLGPVESLIDKLGEAVNSTPLAGNQYWNLLDIQAGLPWLTTATQEQFLPQMLNLDVLHGLSYQKGCYPGQEVIARLHYRGEVKKRVQLFESAQPVQTGDQLVAEDNSNAGTVLNAEQHPDGHYLALAVTTLEKRDDSLRLNGKIIKRMDLPYAIDA